MSYVNRKLTSGFYYLGEFIAKYPRYFIISFAALSLVLSSGIQKFTYVNHLDLYTVSNGDGTHERAAIEKYFISNTTHKFDPSRITRPGRYARIIVTEKNEENMLRADVWREIEDLDREMHEITIEWDGVQHNYSTLCAKRLDSCFENEFLEMADLISDVEKGNARISYPVFFNPGSFKSHALPLHFGGVNRTADGFSLQSVKAITLTYVIAVDSEDQDSKGELWETSVIRALEGRKLSADSKINIFESVYKSFSEENEKAVLSCIVPLAISTSLTSLYIIFTCTSSDWVKSKPILGMMGLVSGFLGTAAAFGTLCFLQVPLIGINIAVPFLLLGIGIDDTFVMISAWHKTSPKDSVPKRTAECFAEAGISITITSLTDMLSFFVGIFTPIPAIQIISTYAGAGILCIYIWQIFFFGPLLAISGFSEAENRHSVFWWMKAIPKSKSASMSSITRFFLTGGIDENDPHNSKDTTENATMVFFRDTFAPFVCKTPVKVGVLVLFVAYWVTACYGITQLKEGLEERNLAREDSYIYAFFVKDQQYFRDYALRLQVAITTPLDYSLNSTQNTVEKMIEKFTSHPKLSEEFNENWLRSFTTYIENYKEFLDYNITDEQSFIKVLRENYLKETSPLSQDVVFNEDETQIIASRFIFQMRNLLDPDTIKNAVIEIRQIAKEMLEEGLEVTVFNPLFTFVDQFIIIRELTIKLLVISIIIVMATCAILIPSFQCCVCILFSICSIELGVLGFMSLWGVSLDFISVIVIVICIGFSVDFCAHVSYAYISSKAETPEERIKNSLYSLGLPILQGSTSSILAILSLLSVPAYMFQTDFKIIFLVIVFATLHGLFLLPVLFTIFTPKRDLQLPWHKSKTYFVTNSESEKNKHNEHHHVQYIKNTTETIQYSI